MKRRMILLASGFLLLVVVFELVISGQLQLSPADKAHFERGESELIVTNPANATVRLFRAGQSLSEATELAGFDGQRIWLPAGNYFLQASVHGGIVFYPVTITGYRAGPDTDGAFVVTLRQPPAEAPPRPPAGQAEFVYIPSGSFLIGDRLNPREPHYVWLPGFFISQFEVTNAEFSQFLTDPRGYGSDPNWTQAGLNWRAANASKATALLKPADPDYQRFGQPDQPVTWVTWYEAQAYGKWLTRKLGAGRWLFALPSEAEWEKVARGPDDFEYQLSRTISDQQMKLYNWKKNPGAAVTVIGLRQSQLSHQPNRYGVFHLTGNVAEWTASVNLPYSREHPYVDSERNREDATDARIVRGGSWYSASIAVLSNSYREAFQPAVAHHDLGFRIVARPLPIVVSSAEAP